MGKFDVNRYLSYRALSSALVAIGLCGILIWSLTLDSPSLLRTEHLMATVIDIKLIENKLKKYSVQLELPGGKIIKLALEQQPPDVGNEMPVIVDVYDDGQTHYIFDKMTWLTR